MAYDAVLTTLRVLDVTFPGFGCARITPWMLPPLGTDEPLPNGILEQEVFRSARWSEAD